MGSSLSSTSLSRSLTHSEPPRPCLEGAAAPARLTEFGEPVYSEVFPKYRGGISHADQHSNTPTAPPTMFSDAEVSTIQIKQGLANLESDELLFPGMQSRQIDLLEGLVAQPQVDPVRGDRELEGHGLVSFCHLRQSPRRRGRRAECDAASMSPDIRKPLTQTWDLFCMKSFPAVSQT